MYLHLQNTVARLIPTEKQLDVQQLPAFKAVDVLCREPPV